MSASRVRYVGAGGAGKSTSLQHVLAASGVRVSKGTVASHDHSVDLEVDGTPTEVILGCDAARGTYSYRDAFAPSVPPQVAAEVTQLKTVNGLIFVIDSRAFRMEAGANQDALVVLRRDLAALGRTLDELPVVFQANFRDQPDAVTMSEVRRQFALPRCEYSETNAENSVGVVETLTRLLMMLRA